MTRSKKYLPTNIPNHLPTYPLTSLTEHPKGAILETCDLWDTDHNSDNWEPEYMTIFVTWQFRLTLDSICNSCYVYFVPPFFLQVCETLHTFLHWTSPICALERNPSWDSHAIYLLRQQLQVLANHDNPRWALVICFRIPEANVGLGKLPKWSLCLADYIMMSPTLFSHLHQRGIHTYLWVLNSEEEYAR